MRPLGTTLATGVLLLAIGSGPAFSQTRGLNGVFGGQAMNRSAAPSRVGMIPNSSQGRYPISPGAISKAPFQPTLPQKQHSPSGTTSKPTGGRQPVPMPIVRPRPLPQPNLYPQKHKLPEENRNPVATPRPKPPSGSVVRVPNPPTKRGPRTVVPQKPTPPDGISHQPPQPGKPNWATFAPIDRQKLYDSLASVIKPEQGKPEQRGRGNRPSLRLDLLLGSLWKPTGGGSRKPPKLELVDGPRKPPVLDNVERRYERDGGPQPIIAGFDGDGRLHIDFDEDGVIDLVLGAPGVTLDAYFDAEGNLWIDRDGDGVGDFGFSHTFPRDVIFPPAGTVPGDGIDTAWDIVDLVLSTVAPLLPSGGGAGYYDPGYGSDSYASADAGYAMPAASAIAAPAATTESYVAGESDTGLLSQTRRYLHVKNNTGEQLAVYLQFRAPDERGEWIWLPANPGASREALTFELAAGQEGPLEYSGAPISASRVRIWAESASRKWVKFHDQDLWLVSEVDADGQRVYYSAAMETFPFTFE